MAVSSAIDNNLAILLLGASMTGGLAYGGYRVFKNNPRPVTELMKSKDRVPLDKEGDKAEWDKNWLQYINTHTITKTTTETSGKPKTSNEEIMAEKDLYGLEDWKLQKDKQVAPDSFKNKCEDLKNTKMLGTWSEEYINYEKYCTKINDSEIEE